MGKGLEGGHLGYVTQLIYINFLSNSPRNFHMNCGFKSSFSFWEKNWNLSDLWPRSKNDLDLWYSFNFINFSWLLWLTFRPKAATVPPPQKKKIINKIIIIIVNFDQIWHRHKMGQVQSRVIIYAIFVVHAYSMLHTMFQGRRSIASGEEFFLCFYYLWYGRGGHVDHLTQNIWTTFRA